jgi:hypothetical protein
MLSNKPNGCKPENTNKNVIMFTTFALKRDIKSKTFIKRILIEPCSFVKHGQNYSCTEDVTIFSITFRSLNHTYRFMFITLY